MAHTTRLDQLRKLNVQTTHIPPQRTLCGGLNVADLPPTATHDGHEPFLLVRRLPIPESRPGVRVLGVRL